MKRNGGLIAGLLAVATFFGVSNLPKTPESTPANGSHPPASASGLKAVSSQPEHYPCEEIATRLQRFVDDHGAPSIDSWKLPDSCYKNYQPPSSATTDVSALDHVGFTIAVVPNPVSTHLPLFFDRLVETIQQAAQDEDYSYDASWFPWDADLKDYLLFGDQHAAEELQKIQESQPGVMVFRRSIRKDHPDNPYHHGLVVFLVAEQPTGGISDDQFQNALEWISALAGFHNNPPLRILGPTFSGSLPSLRRGLERGLQSIHLTGQLELDVSSGTVSAGDDYQWFKDWITGKENKKDSYFRTAMERDSLMVDRFCEYLSGQGYPLDQVAVLSEDETAFGGAGPEMYLKADEPSTDEPCHNAVRFYYPRDIATLRSAYEHQSIFSQAKPQSNTNAPSTTLRGDLSEPSSSDHDTVRSYGGQLTPLAQESVLLDITNRLNEKQIQFIVLRSTNSLDQIFLSEFLRRSYPGGRVVIDGADLLFTRGTEGSSLRGVMVLSTYPLLTSEQDWTPSLVKPRTKGYRTFADNNAEAAYIAARELFRGPNTHVPIHDYGAPKWEGLPVSDAEDQRPPTWLSVVGHRQFWPLAVLSKSPQNSAAGSILDTSPARGDQPLFDDADGRPLRLPSMMWLFLFVLLAWSALHAYFCRNGSIVGPLRGQAYFAPVPLPQHAALIALGSVLMAMLAVAVAAASGLFWWCGSAYPFHRDGTGIFLAMLLFASLALAILACTGNYNLAPLRASASLKGHTRLWQRHAAIAAVVCFVLFALVHILLISRLTLSNAIPAYWRNVNLTSGVSGLLPRLLLLAGAYLWFWCSLRGLAHFGDDRPLLPPVDELPKFGATPMMPMFSQENAGKVVEEAARPLTQGYLKRLFLILAVTISVSSMALHGFWLRTIGERAFGWLIFFWVCLFIAVILADGIEIWRAWSELRKLLIYLDRLPLRRTLRALKGLAWGSIWKMSGNVLEERYRVVTLQLESRRHLTNALEKWEPDTLAAVNRKIELLEKLEKCRAKSEDFARWFVTPHQDGPVDLKHLHDLQKEVASTAAMVMTNVLVPEWQQETDSLIFNKLKEEKEEESESVIPTGKVPLEVLAAEEFFILPYLAFIQNILGRIRTIALGSLWLFVGTTLAVSSYPFDPLNVLGGIFLAVFVGFGGATILVYSQMHRDATLIHITNTEPGALGWDFWGRLLAFGVGPLIGLLTTLFPSITDFVFSWLQPSVQAIK